MTATAEILPELRVHLPSSVIESALPAVDPIPDHELMIAVRAGDIDQLGELFERHHKPLYGFFVRMTGDRTASEDLVQLVFYRILKYRHTYRDEGRFSAWIYHLARRVAADHFHRASTGPAATDPQDLQALPDEAPHAADRAIASDDAERLQTALGRLDPEQRELLVLARFQHLRHEEIARLFNISVGNVKVRVHRALRELRDIYLKLSHEPVL